MFHSSTARLKSCNDNALSNDRHSDISEYRAEPGRELMLIPQAMVSAIDALLRPHDDLDDLPAFVAHADGDRGA